ncbi:ferredoxin [Desulfovibrio subterraneus]|jgi:ferredoxin|uniref:Ferredoxin n=1 Tax=Desulfovibrio subterraneus TaxID=2718620 RepID=A0A7J0BNA0_9BACT|nr:ferredoxin [Desulfovibrio subterraneus]WBF65955.1 ferredoxin [Desulfovibrio subterraneus]GFM35217.1 ferredoxin [Desulfovibrio subterraneus]
MAKILVLDTNECIACESCVELCPEAFRMSSGNEYAEVIDPETKADCVEDAINTCPVQCISWEDA